MGSDGVRLASSRRDDEPRCRGGGTARALLATLDRRANEADEQRMAAARIRRELGVELTAEEPRMLRQLDHFTEIAGGLALCPRTDDKARGLDARQVMVVHFVAMPVALRHRSRTIDPMCERARHDIAPLRAQPHRAAEVGARAALLDRAVAVLPFSDERDHRMRCRRIE